MSRAVAPAGRSAAGFTLLEVLVAVAVLGLALISLLGLHVRNLALLERDRRVTDATLLARAIMTDAEIGGAPDMGHEEGDFEDRFPGLYPELRWERDVTETPIPTMREIRVRVFRDGAAGDDVSLVYLVRPR